MAVVRGATLQFELIFSDSDLGVPPLEIRSLTESKPSEVPDCSSGDRPYLSQMLLAQAVGAPRGYYFQGLIVLVIVIVIVVVMIIMIVILG